MPLLAVGKSSVFYSEYNCCSTRATCPHHGGGNDYYGLGRSTTHVRLSPCGVCFSHYVQTDRTGILQCSERVNTAQVCLRFAGQGEGVCYQPPRRRTTRPLDATSTAGDIYYRLSKKFISIVRKHVSKTEVVWPQHTVHIPLQQVRLAQRRPLQPPRLSSFVPLPQSTCPARRHTTTRKGKTEVYVMSVRCPVSGNITIMDTFDEAAE